MIFSTWEQAMPVVYNDVEKYIISAVDERNWASE